MLERYEKVLKVVCLVLAALMLFQLTRLVFGRSPLAGVIVPALPTLPVTESAKTNLASVTTGQRKGTNSAPELKSKTNETNTVSHLVKQNTNSGSGLAKTNAVLLTKSKETNSVGQIKETNTITMKESGKGSNSLLSPKGMSSFPRSEGGKKAIELPPPIQARVDKITQSEILAPVVRPLPMALLGIAGEKAFLRSANGQTGVVKEGEEVGGLKLLRIGINRVLVEQDGEKKELMVFSGFGGESLLPKEKEKKETNETTKKL